MAAYRVRLRCSWGSFTGRVAGTGAAMAHLADVVRLRLERFPANCLVAGDYLARAGHGDK